MHKRMTVTEAIRHIQENYVNYDTDFVFRGDDYIPARHFRKSKYHGDDMTAFQLRGTSCIKLNGPQEKYIRAAIEEARMYGKNVFLLEAETTNAHSWACDPGEVLMTRNHKIVGIIDLA